jgi:hypothetical protein
MNRGVADANFRGQNALLHSDDPKLARRAHVSKGDQGERSFGERNRVGGGGYRIPRT